MDFLLHRLGLAIAGITFINLFLKLPELGSRHVGNIRHVRDGDDAGRLFPYPNHHLLLFEVGRGFIGSLGQFPKVHTLYHSVAVVRIADKEQALNVAKILNTFQDVLVFKLPVVVVGNRGPKPALALISHNVGQRSSDKQSGFVHIQVVPPFPFGALVEVGNGVHQTIYDKRANQPPKVITADTPHIKVYQQASFVSDDVFKI